MSLFVLPDSTFTTDIKMAVLGSHAAHKTAALAMDGEYTSARANAIGMQRLLQRNRCVHPHHAQSSMCRMYVCIYVRMYGFRNFPVIA